MLTSCNREMVLCKALLYTEHLSSMLTKEIKYTELFYQALTQYIEEYWKNCRVSGRVIWTFCDSLGRNYKSLGQTTQLVH